MTALDPAPVLTSRRDALDQLDALRERVADHLDRPTAEGLRALTAAVKGFARFEAEHVLGEGVLSDFGLERVYALKTGHHQLCDLVNVLSWAVPGSSEAQTASHQLRHELLAQIERYQALRLPRGTIVPGT